MSSDQLRTAGACYLRQAPTPYPHTLRPPTHLPSVMVEPDPPPPLPPMVGKLLEQAYHNHIKPGDDFPYMPHAYATLKEAVHFFRRQGYILVQGGRLNLKQMGRRAGLFSLQVLGRRDAPVIGWHEVIQLLKANYPVDGVRRHPSQMSLALQQEADTLPCMAPAVPPPLPRLGVAFYAMVGYGSDVDNIPEAQWHECSINRAYTDMVYVGDTMVGRQACYVWWSLALYVYVAQ